MQILLYIIIVYILQYVLACNTHVWTSYMCQEWACGCVDQFVAYRLMHLCIYTVAIVIHGGWGEWYASGECSVSCGLGGMRRFERRCDNPRPENGGEPCRGDDFKHEPCNTHCCPGVYQELLDLTSNYICMRMDYMQLPAITVDFRMVVQNSI